jgi:tetratricopeptide (TPR) repeat protein
MPATVQAVLAARIDRLSVGDKRLLQAASVVGKDVPFALLQAVGEVDEDALRACLARLQAGEFLFESGIFPDLEYSFAHALTHEVAYGSLLSDRRIQLHRQILAANERLYADRHAEQVDVLAEHAFRGEIWDKAVQYLREAAAKASARSALQDTVSAYERALTALGRLPETRENTELGIDIKLDLRPALLQMGQLPRVLALSQQAENTARLIKDDRRLARVYTYLVNYHYLKGEPDQVIAYGERCVTLGEALGDPALQTLARGYMGYSYHAQGRYQDAQGVLRANADAPPPDPTRVEAVLPFVSSSGWLGFTLAELGDFETALTYADRARRLADESRHAYSQAIASSLAGLVWIIRGQLDRALPLLQRSLDLCRDKRLTVWEPIPCSLLGITLARLHRIEEGLPLLEEGVARTEELGVRALLALWTCQLAEGYMIAGDTPRARAMAERALDLALAHKERGHQARALRLLGDLARRASPPEPARAERDYAQAIELAQELGMRPLVGRCHLAIGHMHLEAGDRARAEQHLFAAMAIFRELEIQHWLDQALNTLSQLGHLFVVASYNEALYEFLKEKFAADPRVRVVLDRRKGERRRAGDAPGADRRRSDRRRTPVPARSLGERGVMVLAVAQGQAQGSAAI